MRILDCYKELKQHTTDDELVQFDVEYLLKCLGKERGTCYKIVDRPDTRDRQSPQPDYLIENRKTGDLITAEHARFFESEETREKTANLVKKSKSGIVSQWINFPTAEQLGKRLSEFVSEKLSKGQFKSFTHTERILLARNRWGGVRIHRFIEAEPYFKLQGNVDCDHVYLIVEHKLLEIF